VIVLTVGCGLEHAYDHAARALHRVQVLDAMARTDPQIRHRHEAIPGLVLSFAHFGTGPRLAPPLCSRRVRLVLHLRSLPALSV
jgi:hypothetical protein